MHKQNKYTIANTYRSHPFLQYLAQFKQLLRQPSTLSDLSDGIFLLEFAQIIKHFSIVNEVIDSPRTLSQRLSNLKTLFRSIERFWSDILGLEVEGEQIDLVEVARSANQEDMTRLLQLLVKTAVQAENKLYFIQRVLLTSQQTQAFLKGIIEKVFETDSRESPRKEKEKRMYDKILELDHQNDKLQAVLQQVCEEKLELEMRVKTLQARISDNSKELDQLQNLLHEDAFTPQKKRGLGIPDTSDRKDSLIDALRAQVNEMTVQHERQLQAALAIAEKFRIQCSEYEKMRDELALSREIIASHQEFRAQAQLMEQQLSHTRAQAMNKDNCIAYLRQQLDKAARTTADLEYALTTYKGEIERKNMQMGELIGKLEQMERRVSPRKSDGGNLLFDLPDLVNTEAEAYMETNRSLREELERSRRKLQQIQQEVAQQTAELESLRNCSEENRKLRDLVMEFSADRGEENQILVSSLYHLTKLVHVKRG